MIVRARLMAGLRAIGIGYGLLAVLFLITRRLLFPDDPILSSMVEDYRTISSTSGAYGEGLAMVAFLSVVILLVVWMLFWMARAGGVVVWLAGMAGIGFNFFTSGFVLLDNDRVVTHTTVFIYAFTIVTGITFLVLIGLCVRTRLLNWSVAGILAVAWMMLSGVSIMLPGSLFLDERIMLVLWIGFASMPLMTVPLTLHVQRHG